MASAQLLKAMKIKVSMIRHAKTNGNYNGAYIGRTDEELAPGGLAELQALLKEKVYPKVDKVYASDLTRCLQTAKLIYPNQKICLCAGLRECDFGDFEMKNYEQLKDDPFYQAWLQSSGTAKFPNGEDPLAFKNRSQKAFLKICKEGKANQSFAIVCHGGSIMAVLEKYSYPNQEFYDWRVANLGGFSFIFDTLTERATEIMPLQGSETK